MNIRLVFYDDCLVIDYWNSQFSNGFPRPATEIIRYPIDKKGKSRYELSTYAYQFTQKNELELLGKNILINIQHKAGVSKFYVL
jgi:hypothetical protein